MTWVWVATKGTNQGEHNAEHNQSSLDERKTMNNDVLYCPACLEPETNECMCYILVMV